MSSIKVHIAVLIMVKNEHKRLNITLESIKDFANSLVIYDTGSTDDTIDICKNFSAKYNIPLRLKEGEFVNFAVSRNVSLDFADTFDDIDYILLMDTNDELRNGDRLRKYAIEFKDTEKSSFLISQEWLSGEAVNKYFNTRFIKARSNWRYVGPVHEYLHNPDNKNDSLITRLDGDVVLYQDRNKDDDKTSKRFIRDEILLKEEYIKNPTEPRTVFYLAQTYSCLNDIENAYYYHKIRTTLMGFYEERFQSSLKCGEYSEKMGLDWYESFSWYMKAFELIPRVEPLLKIGEHYQKQKSWHLSYAFLNLACNLKYPDQCILFIDRHAYIYKRWHLMSIVAYYINYIAEGKKACLFAIESGEKNNINVELDKSNLKFYLKAEEENETKEPSKEHEELVNKIVTKSEFINTKIAELRKEFPKLTEKQLNLRAKLLWKNK